jgi:tape measure domain-containing protein
MEGGDRRMTTIDSRIVTMKFDNSAFSKGVSSTLSLLDKLRASITGLPGVEKSLGVVQGAANKFTMGNMDQQVGMVSRSFSALEVMAVTTLATITHRAVDAGINMAKSLTLQPLADGFAEYELKMGSIQTILSNTSRYGTTLEDVTKNLDALNQYADKTIYNFGDMTKNIGLFTNAGIRIEDATSMIKGFSNEAAASGTNAQGAASAAYQLSQALSAGTIRLMDWRSLQNVGMGNKNMQRGLVEIADAMGTLDTAGISATEVQDNFNGSLEKNWLSADVMSSYLKIMAGDLSEAEQKSLGLTDAQIKMFSAQQKMSEDAATKVRTWTQLVSTIRESIGSGWSETFNIIFGDFNQATKLFTNLNNAVGGFFGHISDVRNQMLARWEDLGGRKALIDGLANAFEALGNILRPIKNAFRDVFPRTTGKNLYEMTVAFREFTEGLIAGRGTMGDIRDIARAVFGVFGVGIEIVKGIFRYFFSLFGLLGGGAGGLLDVGDSIADIVSKLTQWILKGDHIAKFFDKIIAGRAAALGPIIGFFSDLLSTLAKLVTSGADLAMGRINAAFEALAPYLPVIEQGVRLAGQAIQQYFIAAWERAQPIIETVKTAVTDALDYILSVLSGLDVRGMFSGFGGLFDIGDSADKAANGINKVKNALTGAGSDAAGGFLGGLQALGKGLLDFGGFIGKVGGGILLAIGWLGREIWEAMGSLFSGGGDILGGVGSFIGDLFGRIAEMIGNISYSDIMLAVNTVLVSAIGGGFARMLWQVGGLFKDMRQVFDGVGDVLEGVTSNLKAMALDIKAGALMKIAIALAVLAGALFVISRIDGVALSKALGAVAGMLVMLALAMRSMKASLPTKSDLQQSAQMAALSIALIALAAAVALLAIAVKIMASMSTKELAKGLTAVAFAIGFLVAAAKGLTMTGGARDILIASFALGILAISMTALAGAIKLYARMDTGDMIEGAAKIAAILLALGAAFRMFPTSGAVAGAAAMLIASGALVVMAKAMQMLATLDWKDSTQALLTLTGALFAMVVAAELMNTALPGAKAMVIMSGAIAILSGSLVLLATLDWKDSIQALLLLGGAILVIGGTAAILTPVVPVIAALGGAILILGAGLALIGGGMFLFASGMATLATLGSGAMKVLIDMINEFLEAIPGFLQRLGAGLIEAARQIGLAAPEFMQAAGKILRSFLDEVIESVPKIAETFRVIVREGLRTIRELVPDFVKTGFTVIMAFLRGLDKNIGEITQRAVDIVVKFVNGIADNMDKIVDAAWNLVVKFVKAIGKKAYDQAVHLGTTGWEMAQDIADGMVQGLRGYGAEKVGDAAVALANAIPDTVKDLLGMRSPSKVTEELGRYTAEGFANGISNNAGNAAYSARTVGLRTIEAMKDSLRGMDDISGLDINPTVTPVLDLTQLSNEANRIGSMLSGQTLGADLSYSQASSIAQAQIAAAEREAENADSEPRQIVFKQENHSPKALNPVEIYRNTRNQLALAREELKR